MSNQHTTNDDETDSDAHQDENGDEPRMRFSAIVEQEAQDAQLKADGILGAPAASADAERWNAMSRQVWQVARLTAVFILFAILVGLPLGNFLAHLELQNRYGYATDWSLLEAFPFEFLMVALILPVLVLLSGYILSRALTMMTAAESIAVAAQQIMTPDVTAAQTAETVGAVVQTQVTALNEGLDGALGRLASVEAMIRQHVEAIEIAGEAIEHRATGAIGKVADERAKLMELTESLNSQADEFAVAIAERAKVGVEAMQKADTISLRAESEFEDRLTRLESAAENALHSFESLRDAMRSADETIRASALSVDSAADMTISATEKAKSASNAAAETAALNAANVIASAQRASDAAKDAADAAIASATEETFRVSEAAIEQVKEEGAKVHDVASQVLDEAALATQAAVEEAAAKAAEQARQSLEGLVEETAEQARTALEGATEETNAVTKQAINEAVDEAAKAQQAASEVTEAARITSEAAAKASEEVASAGAQVMQSSKEAIEYSEVAAQRIEERNKALASARADLEQENERLEALMEEQRQRANKLADAIASQTDRLAKLAEAQIREQEAAARLAETQKAAEIERMAAEAARADAEKARAAEEEARRAAQQQRDAARREARAQQEAEETAAREKAKRERKAGEAKRLDELARDIAERRPAARSGAGKASVSLVKSDNENTKSASRVRKETPWKEILDAAEDAEPLDLSSNTRTHGSPAAAASAADDPATRAINIISDLQNFTFDLETRLYGDPPPALQERFERGDRNVFANRLLRLNETDVKRRIRTESGRDKHFERGIHGFLQSFERLLEDATTSETADEELEEYLSSPLGRVYLLIGATVGYFA